jgi:hypothetical protein
MQDINEILGQIRLPERVYPLCLRADLRGRWEELNRRLRQAEIESADSLAGGSNGDLAEQVRALETEMADHTVHIRLRALRSKTWSDLVAKHPPRKGVDDGATNGETFGIAVLAACAVDPIMSEDQAGQLVDAMTNGQWSDLQTILANLNNGSVEVPKSRLASEILQGSTKR